MPHRICQTYFLFKETVKWLCKKNSYDEYSELKIGLLIQCVRITFHINIKKENISIRLINGEAFVNFFYASLIRACAICAVDPSCVNVYPY